MTEQEWLNSVDPAGMLKRIHALDYKQFSLAAVGPPTYQSDRKLRLFIVAGLRAAWNWLKPSYTNGILTHAEKIADSIPLSPIEKLKSYEEGYGLAGDCLKASMDPGRGAAFLISEIGRHNSELLPNLACILRDIFGNIGQPVIYQHCWTTPTVQAIANEIYDQRYWRDMPVLADALEDAGCEQVCPICNGTGQVEQGGYTTTLTILPCTMCRISPRVARGTGKITHPIITHLRGKDKGQNIVWNSFPPNSYAKHTRGCWALDLILGKE